VNNISINVGEKIEKSCFCLSSQTVTFVVWLETKLLFIAT